MAKDKQIWMNFTLVVLLLCIPVYSQQNNLNQNNPLPNNSQVINKNPVNQSPGNVNMPSSTKIAPSLSPTAPPTNIDVNKSNSNTNANAASPPGNPPDLQTAVSSGWLEKLDNDLNTSLAATMAGLSLTAGIFLIGIIVPIINKNKQTLENVPESSRPALEAEFNKELEELRRATSRTMGSFFVFFLFLIESLTGDHWANTESVFKEYKWTETAEPIFSGSLLLLGTYLLLLGAKSIKGIVIKTEYAKNSVGIETPKPNTSPPKPVIESEKKKTFGERLKQFAYLFLPNK